ncbi:MAG: hypothetical protein COT33_00870 [Candidatus Nealsonbacteria bacterium CG08_land_8_20_14_0_20_38_20]|uniref:Uncharacterized protein n=1 Tax=Candidatus Nealsonbacteria bacterium CG08_land_8_20_14_0_20_38_20 TaxID=1974705 RepID=A0A2H0YPG4_9BACT|nr:MAG: hypothetical protein COT33_00870 [Candidatus Nealsonbacteria bacterium CG08_land_8_20_14_0_20_38_20]
MKKTIIKTTIIAVILNLALFNISFALKVPDTLEEAGELGKKTVEVARTKLPGALKNVWQEDVIPVWQKIVSFEQKVGNWFVTKLKSKTEEEVKKRKAIIGEDFKKEKEKFKKEVPQLGKNLWERFKELIK